MKEVKEVSFHRNGISGEGFHAVLFVSDIEPDDPKLKMAGIDTDDVGQNDALFLGIVFDTPGQCAVICVDRIASHGIAFAQGNSWRGDRYEPELRAAIKSGTKTKGVRVGPFAIG